MLFSDDDVIDVIHEQLMINVTGMDHSEEVCWIKCILSWPHIHVLYWYKNKKLLIYLPIPASHSFTHVYVQSYVWLDIEVERIFHEIKLTQAPAPTTKRIKGHNRTARTSSRAFQPRRSYGSHSGPKRGIPWRAAARSSQRWWVVLRTFKSQRIHVYLEINWRVV